MNYFYITRATSLIILGTLLAACVTSTEPNLSEIYMKSSEATVRSELELIAFRHDLHRNPEVGGQEIRTSTKVTEQLERLGFEVRTGIGGYGVIGLLAGKQPRPVIAFRADMDATAQYANDPVPYASEVDGVYHVCGHDVHTAIGIGLAEGFASIQNNLQGTVMLVFQPEEELGTGADDMLREGIFTDIKPDAILAVHTAPFDVGELHVTPNEMIAGRTAVHIKITGSGNVNEAANEILKTLLGLATVTPPATYEWGPQEFISVDVLSKNKNGTQEHAEVTGFITSDLGRRAEVKSLVFENLEPLVFDNVTVEIDYKQALEGVNNDPNILKIANKGIADMASNIKVLPVPGIIPAWSEDFGSFQKKVPGVMYLLGVNNPITGTKGFPHTPDYVADDDAIMVGVNAMMAAMLALMNQDYP